MILRVPLLGFLMALLLSPAALPSVHAASVPATASTLTPPPPPMTPTTTPATPVPADGIRALLKQINRDRAAHHVAPLVLDARQSRCSVKHSAHMAKLGYISHDQFPADVCVHFLSAAENVGQATGNGVASLLLLDRIMMEEGPCPHRTCSPADYQRHGHFLNLVNPAFHRVGIGITVQNGMTWLTEDFVA